LSAHAPSPGPGWGFAAAVHKEDIMSKQLKDALAGLKRVSGSANLSQTEKDLIKHVSGALASIDERLTVLERGNDPTREITDTPQGENAPLSR
jgi:hypothetical protein